MAVQFEDVGEGKKRDKIINELPIQVLYGYFSEISDIDGRPIRLELNQELEEHRN